ncbi:MAG: hypothetical protein QXK24_02350 [Ignisphaera sp.]|uniref:Uncharacterized protein n=1 Tax=Ignisphaera aggregans TaxID=334771 RepID=A0A7C4JJT0_9CREN
MPGNRSQCCFIDRVRQGDLEKIATMIFDEWLKDPDKESFSVVDRLATTVSHEVAKFALYEVVRVVERSEQYRDVYWTVNNLISGLDCETHREEALDKCKNIALLALSMRFKREGG